MIYQNIGIYKCSENFYFDFNFDTYSFCFEIKSNIYEKLKIRKLKKALFLFFIPVFFFKIQIKNDFNHTNHLNGYRNDHYFLKLFMYQHT